MAYRLMFVVAQNLPQGILELMQAYLKYGQVFKVGLTERNISS
jgi:hypothetical protein